jgi:hypothetical protein
MNEGGVSEVDKALLDIEFHCRGRMSVRSYTEGAAVEQHLRPVMTSPGGLRCGGHKRLRSGLLTLREKSVQRVFLCMLR